MKKQLFVILFLVLLSIPTVRDLFKPGAYTSHDLTHHIVRTIQMDKILREGQFPPRWVGDLNWGYGYPLFIFNYPLPSMMAVGIHWLGNSFIWSVKLTMAFSMVASLLAMYIFIRYLFKSELAGIVGGLFYLYAPIRFINVYVSATFGNAVAFMFVPLIFWAITKASRGNFDKKSLLGGALSLAGLILSHNIMALMFLPIVVAYTVFLIWQSPKKLRVSMIHNSLFLILLGLGLSSFFLVPAMVEKSEIRYDSALTGFYKTHFPAWWQLIRSHWGYGFSHPGTAQDDMSFQIGLAHIGVFVLSALWLIVGWKKISHFDKSLLWFCFGACLVIVFLMLEISMPVWEKIPMLPYIQMPWRLLAVIVFIVSILAGWLVKYAPLRPLCALILALAVIIANRNHWHINEIMAKTDADYMTINNSTTMASEHLPKGSNKFDNEPIAYSKITPQDGLAAVVFDNNTSIHVAAKIIALEDNQVIRFNQVYFPGWQFSIDGIPVTGSFPINKPLPEFTVSKGTHTFTASFTNTPLRTIADIISLLSAMVIIGITIQTKYDFQPKTLANNHRHLPS